jgi:hypothetical protein
MLHKWQTNLFAVLHSLHMHCTAARHINKAKKAMLAQITYRMTMKKQLYDRRYHCSVSQRQVQHTVYV